MPLAAGLGVLAVAAYASISYPAYHFVLLAHLHNLVPLIFLWDWAARIGDSGARLAFRLTQVRLDPGRPPGHPGRRTRPLDRRRTGSGGVVRR